jgi:hypothetical protein
LNKKEKKEKKENKKRNKNKKMINWRKLIIDTNNEINIELLCDLCFQWNVCNIPSMQLNEKKQLTFKNLGNRCCQYCPKSLSLQIKNSDVQLETISLIEPFIIEAICFNCGYINDHNYKPNIISKSSIIVIFSTLGNRTCNCCGVNYALH